MEVQLDKETALIEAVLFLEADPLDGGSLARISGLSREAVEKALERLENRFNAPDSGLELIRIGGGVMVSPKKEFWDILKDRYGKKSETGLSRAARETLSLIAYSQPITKSEIKAIRGVEPDNMIRLLLERKLIRETGKKDVPGKPVQYGTTKEFLMLFGLPSIADLPKLDDKETDRFELENL